MMTPTSLDSVLELAHGPNWANRWNVAPLTNKQSHPDGTLSDDEYVWLTARASGGFGAVRTCAAYVAQAGKAWQGQLAIDDDRHLPGLRRLAEGIRQAGAVSTVQLHHGGRRADPAVSGVPAMAPWADAERGVLEMRTADVKEMIEDFVTAAQRAETAGFDGVEIHGAHGYVLGQFLDGNNNHRDDGFGGSLDDRMRPMLEVVRGIHESTGPDFQVGLRLSPERFGVVVPEAKILAENVMTSGLIDYLDMSLWDVAKAPHDATIGGLLIDQFTDLARGTTRLGVAGKILSAADARWCLERGADFVSVGTAAIIHHDLPRRIQAQADFVSEAQPFPRRRLEEESLSASFIDYLAASWDDFVA